MHGRSRVKWAAIPSLTLVEQKMSHASSQSLTCFPVRWLYVCSYSHVCNKAYEKPLSVLWSVIRVFPD